MKCEGRFNPRSDARKSRDEPGVGDDIACSKCGAVALDTGLECTECGHDMRPELYGHEEVTCHEAMPPVPPPSQPAAEARDALKERLTDLLAHGLRGTYHCTRVWHAWAVGTMSEDDFEPVDESDTPAELADAIIAVLSTHPDPPQARERVMPLPEQKLPAPRLQLRWEVSTHHGYQWQCNYELVLALDKWDIRAEQEGPRGGRLPPLKELVVPIKPPSMRNSSAAHPPCTAQDGSRYCDTPYRDGAHALWDAKQLGNPPIYVIAPDGTAFLHEEQGSGT